MFIPDPDPYFLPILDPGSRGQKGTGSRIRIRNTAYYFFAYSRSCHVALYIKVRTPFYFHAHAQQIPVPYWYLLIGFIISVDRLAVTIFVNLFPWANHICFQVQKHYSLVFSSDEEHEGLGADDLMTGLLKEIRTAKKSSKHEKSTKVGGKNKRNSGGGDVKKVKKSVSKKGKETKRTIKKKTVRKSKGKGTETAAQLSDSLRNEYLGELAVQVAV